MVQGLDLENLLTKELPWIDRPEADIDAFARNYPKPVSFNLAEKLKFWRKYGYVVFRNTVSHELIDQYLAELEHLRSHFHDYLVSIEVRGEQTWSQAVPKEVIDDPYLKLNHLHTQSLYAARLSLVREVTEFLEALFGAPAVPMQSLTFWRGSQQATHIDYPYVKMQRRLAYMAASWVPLEDVHPDSGPLAYFPGAHRLEVTKYFDWGAGSILSGGPGQTRNGLEFADFINEWLHEAKIYPEVFLPRKGDVLIWHCNMPHLGTPVRDAGRTRKSYVTHFTGLDDYPEDWFPAGEDQEREVLRDYSGMVMDFPWAKPEGKLPSWRAYFAGV
jgi:ectoine hydroxylase-related dioxygenase (phytanoyl-CoA dioxygenase family)